MRSKRRPGAPAGFAVIVALVVLVPIGVVTGAGLQVIRDAPETGVGSVVTAPPAGTSWVFTGLAVVTAPSGLASVSVNASQPTNLSSSGGLAYGVGGVSTGSTAITFASQLLTTAPNSTELELRFSIALTGPATVLTVYVETPATPPGTALTERFYVATTTPSFTGLTLESFAATSAVCTSVGVCP